MKFFKDKPKLNLLIDAVMFVVLMCVAGLGFLIKFVLIPGYKRNLIYGQDVELYFLKLDRHEWGSIHLWLNFLFLFLLLLHILLHWKNIVCIFQQIVTGISMRRGIAISIGAMGLILAVAPLFIRPDVGPLPRQHIYSRSSKGYRGKAGDTMVYDRKFMADAWSDSQTISSQTDINGDTIVHSSKNQNNLYLNRRSLSDQTGNASDTSLYHHGNITGVLLSDQETDENQGERLHRNAQEEIEVYGYMTLNEIAGKYKVSPTELANALKIPVEKSDLTLGRLRKQYNFYMSDVRDIVLKLSE